MLFFRIIIPAYNCERFLRQCLDSILNQSYTDWQPIVVDDGSKDSTPEIIDEYASKDKRIVAIHKHNGGECSARNAALLWARDNYLVDESWLCFVDSDDFVDSKMCEILYGIIANHPNLDFIRSYNIRYSDVLQGHTKNLNGTVEYITVDKENYFFDSRPGGFISSIVVKESIVVNNGVLFDEQRLFLGDQ